MHSVLKIALILSGILLSVSAYAAGILNLSEGAQSFEVQTARGWQPFTIEKNDSWNISGDAKIKYLERDITIKHDEHYAVWPGGHIGPQRKVPNGDRRF